MFGEYNRMKHRKERASIRARLRHMQGNRVAAKSPVGGSSVDCRMRDERANRR